MKQTLFYFTRRTLYLGLHALDRFIGNKTSLSILCYHAINDDEWRFSINPAEFKKQILTLKKTTDFISFDDLVLYLNGAITLTKPSVLLTFDDGYDSLWNIRDFINREHIRPAVFLLSQPDNADRTQLETSAHFLTIAQVKQLKKDGWTFGCHSATHTDFNLLDTNQALKEVVLAKNILEEQLGEHVSGFAYPKGRYTNEVLQAVKDAGYRVAMSMNPGFISSKTDPLKLPRIGVDRSHTLAEFQALSSPSVITAREIVMKTPLRNLV